METVYLIKVVFGNRITFYLMLEAMIAYISSIIIAKKRSTLLLESYILRESTLYNSMIQNKHYIV